MLRTLYIRNYALIEELEVSFGPGLNVLTGETGAGKSILVGALKLLLGDRASPDWIRKGASKAVLEATLDLFPDDRRVRAYLEAQGIEAESTICLRRELSSTQSRAFVNDTPVTLTVLREVGSYLMDLHGQHEHQSLLRVEQHGYLLDSVAGLNQQVEAYEARYRRYQALLRRRRELEQEAERQRQWRELYVFQAQEIDAVGPSPDEEAELEAERRRLENVERLFESTARLHALLAEGEKALIGYLATVVEELEDLARIDEAFRDWTEEARSAQVAMEELARFLLDYQGRLVFDPDRLHRGCARLPGTDRPPPACRRSIRGRVTGAAVRAPGSRIPAFRGGLGPFAGPSARCGDDRAGRGGRAGPARHRGGASPCAPESGARSGGLGCGARGATVCGGAARYRPGGISHQHQSGRGPQGASAHGLRGGDLPHYAGAQAHPGPHGALAHHGLR
jgi:energy-coupling factor transporter ATP-binding protein EcfA2